MWDLQPIWVLRVIETMPTVRRAMFGVWESSYTKWWWAKLQIKPSPTLKWVEISWLAELPAGITMKSGEFSQVASKGTSIKDCQQVSFWRSSITKSVDKKEEGKDHQLQTHLSSTASSQESLRGLRKWVQPGNKTDIWWLLAQDSLGQEEEVSLHSRLDSWTSWGRSSQFLPWRLWDKETSPLTGFPTEKVIGWSTWLRFCSFSLGL